MSNGSEIVISGAREHNLKGVSLAIPRDALVVFTGLSGSGKSSLAFDTIHAEGRRRYVESLGVHARQFLDKLRAPEVDSIEGLSPTIAVDQATTSPSPRSTVGTVTEIADHLRLLWARVGRPHCHRCGAGIDARSAEQIVDHVMELPDDARFMVMAPVAPARHGGYEGLLGHLRAEGYARVKVDGKVRLLGESLELDGAHEHDVAVVVDRLVMRAGLRKRVADSIETALALGDGIVQVEVLGDAAHLTFSERFTCLSCGSSMPELEPRLFSFNSPHGSCELCTGLGSDPISGEPCRECRGARLRPESRAVLVGGIGIHELSALPAERASAWVDRLELTPAERHVAEPILREVSKRLRFLDEVGVGYLSLDRAATTLSGGEAQRIRLATQIGSALVDVLYVLDEPSLGLHPSDNAKLIATLERLRDKGNTVLVVEHDEQIMRAADHVVDLGPGAGDHGGHVVAQGTAADLERVGESLTGRFLAGTMTIPAPARRRAATGHVELRGVSRHNLKDVDVRIPLGVMTAVTGVSGSGKSTLVGAVLGRALVGDQLDKVVRVDQSPLGRTPRSNAATYTGLFDEVRELFARTQQARVRGYRPDRFSFNVKGGRCEVCRGDGQIKIEMHFLPDVYVPCEQCHGKRYNRETLAIRYKGKTIADVLDMTVEDALLFFERIPKIKRRLDTLSDVGLGYLRLGQPATTLSGGEAQRLKLAAELSKVATGRTLYVLDEPTSGLHFADVQRLLEVLRRLVDAGNSVVVIEHDLDVIKTADWVVDMGPDGGDRGGSVVGCGTPEQIATDSESHTGRLLAGLLTPARGHARAHAAHGPERSRPASARDLRPTRRGAPRSAPAPARRIP